MRERDPVNFLGEKAPGLSATNVVRLKAGWEADYTERY
jgi:hypothetical protein